MQQAKTFFNADEQARLTAAVAAAEQRTAAEIVPVVARISGRYDRAECIVGLWLGALLMILTWIAFQQSPDGGMWDTPWTAYELPSIVLALAVGALAGTWAASRMQGLCRVFIPRKEMREECRAAAARAFHDQRLHHTTGGTGLLIYLSRYERTAVLLADEAVLAILGQETLDAYCARIVAGVKSGGAAEALCAVITDAGTALAEALPRQDDDTDELPNALRFID